MRLLPSSPSTSCMGWMAVSATLVQGGDVGGEQPRVFRDDGQVAQLGANGIEQRGTRASQRNLMALGLAGRDFPIVGEAAEVVDVHNVQLLYGQATRAAHATCQPPTNTIGAI